MGADIGDSPRMEQNGGTLMSDINTHLNNFVRGDTEATHQWWWNADSIILQAVAAAIDHHLSDEAWTDWDEDERRELGWLRDSCLLDADGFQEAYSQIDLSELDGRDLLTVAPEERAALQVVRLHEQWHRAQIMYLLPKYLFRLWD